MTLKKDVTFLRMVNTECQKLRSGAVTAEQRLWDVRDYLNHLRDAKTPQTRRKRAAMLCGVIMELFA